MHVPNAVDRLMDHPRNDAAQTARMWGGELNFYQRNVGASAQLNVCFSGNLNEV